MERATCCSAMCSQAIKLAQQRCGSAPTLISCRWPRKCEGEPKLSLMLPGIAAHCDPTSPGDLECKVSRMITRRCTDVQPHREIRISNLRQPPRGRPSNAGVARRGARRRRRLPIRTERPNAFRRPLVLPHRSCHQTALLVRWGREGKAFSGRAEKVCSVGRGCFATERNGYAAVDRRCARRTALAADARRAGDERHPLAAYSSDSRECCER